MKTNSRKTYAARYMIDSPVFFFGIAFPLIFERRYDAVFLLRCCDFLYQLHQRKKVKSAVEPPATAFATRLTDSDNQPPEEHLEAQ